MRRAWWLVGAAALILLAGACSGGNGDKKTPTALTGTTPTAAATSATGATATAGLASPTVAGGESTPMPAETTAGLRACGPSDVTARASEQSGEGSISGAVTITNTSSAACGIAGETVTLRDSTGAQLASGSGGSSVQLAAGQAASITFIWTNWCGDAPSGPLSVAVDTGGDPVVTNIAGTSAGAVPVPRCDAQAEPSKLSITDVRVQTTR
ncbi:MAG TPA: DUF4232 domain-containing protein [Dehalococcoidia bacterium]|nr:DUF4232 domain-containing protein [Dehalococcoidia bacterium]